MKKNSKLLICFIFFMIFSFYKNVYATEIRAKTCNDYNTKTECESEKNNGISKCIWSSPVKKNYCTCSKRTCSSHQNAMCSGSNNVDCSNYSYCKWTSYCSSNPNYVGSTVKSTDFYCNNSNYTAKSVAKSKPNSNRSVPESSKPTKCAQIFTSSEPYTSEWNSSSKCCLVKIKKSDTNIDTDNNISNSSNIGNQSSNKSKSTSNNSVSSSKYEVVFNQNEGYGLTCEKEEYYKDVDVGICAGEVSKNTEITFPSSSKDMKRIGQGELMGWSKSANCVLYDENNPVISYDEKYQIVDNSYFYACYRSYINGDRYLANGAIVDGGTEVECGTKVKIEYCNRENGHDYCYYLENGNYRKVDRNKVTNSYEGAACDSSSSENIYEGWMYPTYSSDDFSCGEALYISSCSDKKCKYTQISKYNVGEISKKGNVYKSKLKSSSDEAKKECDSKQEQTVVQTKVEESEKKCSTNTVIPNMRRKEDVYSICYSVNDSENTIKNNLEKYYGCDTNNGYYFDRTSVVALDDADCNSNGICRRTYSVSCVKGKASKPTMNVTSGIVGSNGYGIIKVTAKAKEGKIDSYFVSDYYITPTNSSKWIKLNSNNFEIESTPGIKYIWVRDSKGNISYAVSGSVIDTNNTSTTINKLELYDSYGNVQTPKRTVSYNNSIKDAKYVRLSNDFSKDSNVLADGFNPFDMEYKLEVSSPTISVYATLTSKDSKYVDGYEPRTVNLQYGVNTILIKIQDKEGKVRTYTILVTRTDNRTSDNTLNNIELSVGKINFNANVTDYKIEIPSNTTSLNVNATISSDKASYVTGYEPGEVNINDDTIVKLIKVKSETGSTRTYVLTFVKKGTDYIEDESLQFRDLVIPGVYIPFESDVVNYSLSVEYETESIDLNPILNDKNGYYEIYVKNNQNGDYNLTSNTGISLDVGENFIEIEIINSDNNISYYKLTIIRKEFGLDISGDTTLKDLKVLGYNINFKPDKKEYTVRIKQEKSLVITAVPTSNRAEVFIRGNDELTGFSTVRIKVVAENGETETYSIDIKKDAFNKTIEIASIIFGAVIILASSCIIIIKKKNRAKKEYFEE